MNDPQLKAAIFDFEELSAELDTIPIAARRALDHAGQRMSLTSWRSLTAEDRRRLVIAGADELVDVARVASAVRRAQPPAQAVDPVGDPDPLVAPAPVVTAEGPARWVDPAAWSRLRSLERYALSHEHRRAIARSDATRYAHACDQLLAREHEEATGRRVAPPPEAPRERRSAPPEAGEQDAFGRYAAVTPRGLNWSEVAGRPLPEARTGRSVFPPPLPGRSLTPQVSNVVRREGSVLPPGNPLAPRREPALPSPAPTPLVPPPPRHPLERPSPPPPARDAEATRAISTHVLPSGEVHMVDVGAKPETHRRAVASGRVHMRPETALRILRNEAPKGEVLATARLAGIMAAKRTPELIPLCHTVRVSSVVVDIDLDATKGQALVTAIVDAFDRTGVEMEALTAASVACLTLYDMLKGVDRDMVVTDLKLVEKSGGRTGDYRRKEP
jgi:cyclic pyranopterin phosphate synthase